MEMAIQNIKDWSKPTLSYTFDLRFSNGMIVTGFRAFAENNSGKEKLKVKSPVLNLRGGEDGIVKHKAIVYMPETVMAEIRNLLLSKLKEIANGKELKNSSTK